MSAIGAHMSFVDDAQFAHCALHRHDADAVIINDQELCAMHRPRILVGAQTAMVGGGSNFPADHPTCTRGRHKARGRPGDEYEAFPGVRGVYVVMSVERVIHFRHLKFHRPIH